MLLDHEGKSPTPKVRSLCALCKTEIRAKCGKIVTWHWAHKAKECDPWSEPEGEWHRQWKISAATLGADIEVVMGEHRADIVSISGHVIELQNTYLTPEQIEEREAFYGEDMVWVYRCHWIDRLNWGPRGFWWKHPAKSLTFHRRLVHWHVPEHKRPGKMKAEPNYLGRLVRRWEDFPEQIWRVGLRLTHEQRVIGWIEDVRDVEEWKIKHIVGAS